MSTSNPRRKVSAMKPLAEALEARQLLTTTIRGIDLDGDRWTLKLTGPGDFRVTKQNNVPLNQPGLIDTITIAGGATTKTVLNGTVKRGANGDGKVFFQNLESLNNPTIPDVNGIIRLDTNGRGLKAIDMPRFWMADTSNGTTTDTVTGSINMPDGVTALRFGGVDATAFTKPAAAGTTFQVNLGLPQVAGTSIILDKVITQQRPATASGGAPLQDAVTFTVLGRLNLFQANDILGNPTEATGPYEGVNAGGTTINNTVDAAGTTGQIGFLRIGGQATNLTVAVQGPAGSPDFAKISEMYFGGETNKVVVNAPGGIRNAKFARGMDTVAIATRTINHLAANRGAVGSTVYASGPIVLAEFGGDVIDSRILSGDSVTTAATATTPAVLDVGGGGQLTAMVGGNIINSVFASSTVPLDSENNVTFDLPDTILYESGSIKGKVEGTVDNSAILPNNPNQAFFAQNRTVARGPVQPPNVVVPPFDTPTRLHKGQIGLTGRPGPLGSYSVPSLGAGLLSARKVRLNAAKKG